MKDIKPSDAARISGGGTPFPLENDPSLDPSPNPQAQPLDPDLAPGVDPGGYPQVPVGVAPPPRVS
jgi:hypothetical protein